MFDNRQSQTCATSGGIAAGIHAIEALGQTGEMLLFYARAVVADGHINVLVVAPGTQAYLATWLSVFDGVDQQVGKGAVQFFFIALQLQVWRAFKVDILGFFAAQRCGFMVCCG
jgi:hypothetical protein